MQPPPLPEEPASGMSSGTKFVAVAAAIVVPPLVAAGLALMGMLMLAFASDAGVKDHDAAMRWMAAHVWAWVGFGSMAIPATLAVLSSKPRRRRWWIATLVWGGLSLIAAIAFAGLYLRAVTGSS